MSKRKLSQRQSARVKKIQKQRVERASHGQLSAEHDISDEHLGPEQQGLLIARYGATVDVEDKNGEIFHCHIRQNIGDLVPGDNVIWRQAQDETGVVVALLPRESTLARPDSQGNMKPLAANISLMVIVIAPNPLPSIEVIDRYLVAATLLQITPCLILNKVDLLDKNNEQFLALISLYEEIGYNIIHTSATRNIGIDTLSEQLQHHTSVFVGQSGVGKSSLIDTLIPELNIKVGEISETKGLGKHTTTTARLYHFAAGGHLIDSPGVRRFNLWRVSPEELIHGFVEFKPYIGQCKFRDCQHKQEPGCAITAAVKAGKIQQVRLDSYHHLYL